MQGIHTWIAVGLKRKSKEKLCRSQTKEHFMSKSKFLGKQSILRALIRARNREERGSSKQFSSYFMKLENSK